MYSSLIPALVLLFCPAVLSVVYVQYPDSLPSDISTDCYSALVADIDCDESLERLLPDRYYPDSFLSVLCTEGCNAALGSYESDIVTACGSQTYPSNTTEGDVPLSTIPQLLRYTFNQTCLYSEVDGGYCNSLFAAELGIADDQSNLNSEDIQGGGNVTCDDCVLKTYQFLAGSPFYSDEDVKNTYSSLTSSCQATEYPLSTSTFTFKLSTSTSTGTDATATASVCDGTTYAVQAGDTCESVSKDQGVGTTWLLYDNGLSAYCGDFPSSGSLCIKHSCTTYTVQSNDTCTSIALAHSMTYAQVLAWNPNFDLLCSNIARSVGLEICISTPGDTYTVPGVTVTAAVTSATTAAAVPTNLAQGSTTNCGLYVEAQAGDYCNLLIVRYGISLANFLILNPEVNENCTNLYAEESYCVEPVGDISQYSGAPGYASVTTAASTVPYSSLPVATYVPAEYVPYNASYANGTSSLCGDYVDGTDINGQSIAGTFYQNGCELVESVWSITAEQLYLWNPSLNTSVSDCALQNETLYCVQQYVVTATQSAYVPLPTASTVANCSQYAIAGAGVPCDTFLYWANITLEYFVLLNPTVGSDCSGLESDTYYCVSAPGVAAPTATGTTSAIASATSSTVSAPGPTQTGIPANCNAYYVVQSGDSCSSVEAQYGITDTEFHSWNPAVSSDCLSGFWADEAYCVGVSGDDSTSTTVLSSTGAVATTTATTTSVSVPGPTQAGIPSNCNAYYVAQSGDSCASVEAAYGITNDEFHEWNPAVSSDCLSGFWADEAYCVGISS